MSETEGKYSVGLFNEGGEDAGQEAIVDRHDNLTVARATSTDVLAASRAGRGGGGDGFRTPPKGRCLYALA